MGGKASEPSKKIKKYSFPFVQKREHLSVKVINEPLNCMQKKIPTLKNLKSLIFTSKVFEFSSQKSVSVKTL